MTQKDKVVNLANSNLVKQYQKLKNRKNWCWNFKKDTNSGQKMAFLVAFLLLSTKNFFFHYKGFQNRSKEIYCIISKPKFILWWLVNHKKN